MRCMATALSMFGSLLFGLVYYVILPGSDNIFGVMHDLHETV